MILVIGGLNGFVGSNTTEALVELGHDCVVTSHQNSDAPAFLEKRMGRGVAVEHADATSVDDLRSLGEKHEIDGIVNVAGGFAPSTGWPVPLIGGYFEMLSATLRVAAEWKVSRLLFSSTGGIYFGTGAGPSREDQPIPIPSIHPLVAAQKVVEIAAAEFAKKTGISTVCARLGACSGRGRTPGMPGCPRGWSTRP